MMVQSNILVVGKFLGYLNLSLLKVKNLVLKSSEQK
jgi:hypothetical protein